MEYILAIGLLLFIGWVFDKIGGFFKQRDPNKKFRITFTTQQKKYEGEKIETIQFKISGVLSFKKKITKPAIIFRLYDITGTDAQNGIPVRSFIKEWRPDCSLNLVIKETIPGEIEIGAGSLEPVLVKEIPVLCINFPRKGNQRNILISCIIIDQSTGEIVNTAEVKWLKDIVQNGYLDNMEIEKDTIGNKLKLLMCCASVDGNYTQAKADFITEWSKKYVEDSDALDKSEFYSIINTSYQEGAKEIESGRMLLLQHDALKNISKNRENINISNFFESCCKLVAEDGDLHPEESSFVRSVIDKLEISHSESDLIYNKHLLLLTPIFNPSSREDIAGLLGITQTMSRTEVSVKITTLYKKYQALQVHSSPEKRLAASKWMEVLSLARIQHLS
jgi:hypothetical protein